MELLKFIFLITMTKNKYLKMDIVGYTFSQIYLLTKIFLLNVDNLFVYLFYSSPNSYLFSFFFFCCSGYEKLIFLFNSIIEDYSQKWKKETKAKNYVPTHKNIRKIPRVLLKSF